jgi:hypothetical protein
MPFWEPKLRSCWWQVFRLTYLNNFSLRMFSFRGDFLRWMVPTLRNKLLIYARRRKSTNVGVKKFQSSLHTYKWSINIWTMIWQRHSIPKAVYLDATGSHVKLLNMNFFKGLWVMRNGESVPGRMKGFLQTVQTVPRAQPGSYSTDIGKG